MDSPRWSPLRAADEAREGATHQGMAIVTNRGSSEEAARGFRRGSPRETSSWTRDLASLPRRCPRAYIPHGSKSVLWSSVNAQW